MTQPYEKVSQKLSFKQIIWNNFVGGVAWAVGATVGISLVFGILGLLAKNINFVPIFGSFASDVLNFVLAHNQNLQK